MANFRKRSGKWQARIQRGNVTSPTKTFATYQDAQKWARKIEREYDQGHYESINVPIPLTEALLRYETEISQYKKRPEIERYRINAWLKTDLSLLRLHQIKTHHLAVWRNTMINKGYKPNTIRLHLALLSHLFTIAITEWGFEDLKNPVTNLTKPKCTTSKDTRISDQEIDLLIKHTQSPYLPNLIHIALYTGMRRSEIIKLTWKDINWEKNNIQVRDTKNGENRNIPLFKALKRLLLNMKSDSPGQLFPITEHAVSVAFRRSVMRSNLPNISFHTLRHEAITRFFEQGLSIPEVAMISGHKSWAMLRRYTHLQNIMSLKQRGL